MSVLMTLRMTGDGSKLEEYARGNEDKMQHVVGLAKNHGVIAHHFYGAGDEIMVLDEWPSEESFHEFFQEAQEEIQQFRTAVGSDGEPSITFWRRLSIGDDVG